MRALFALALLLALVGLAACGDAPTAAKPPESPRLQMARASWAEAARLDTLARASEAAGDVYRPLLLRGVVDALQFGIPMAERTVTIGGAPVSMRAVVMHAVAVDGARADSAAFLFAWTGPRADTVLVVGAGLAFFLPGGDAPALGASVAAAFGLGILGNPCPAYDDATGLGPPPALACDDQPISSGVDLTLDSGVAVSAPDAMAIGVRVVRETQLAPSAALAKIAAGARRGR